MWYVYMLCDPDTEQPFYIGKGKGDRMHYHEQTLNNKSDVNNAKKEIIRKILAQGKQVLKRKIAEFDNEQEAYAFEVQLIKQHKEQITNIKPGGGRLYSQIEKKPEPEKVYEPRIYTSDDEYMPISQIVKDLGWNKNKLNYVIRKLHITTHKFPYNKHGWIATDDVKRIKDHGQ